MNTKKIENILGKVASGSADIDTIRELVDQVARIKMEAERLDGLAKAAKKHIAAAMEQNGTNVIRGSFASARLVEPSPTETYDIKALKSAAAINPELAEILTPFKVVRSRRPYIRLG